MGPYIPIILPWLLSLLQTGEGEGEGAMDVIITITCFTSRIDFQLIALDAHMLTHTAYGPGPGPISSMAEHICIKGNK